MGEILTCCTICGFTMSRVLSRGFEGWKLPPSPQTIQLPPKKRRDHSGHSLLCLKIINISMHQITSLHISIHFQKILNPLEYSWPLATHWATRWATRTDFSPKRKIPDRTLMRHDIQNTVSVDC